MKFKIANPFVALLGICVIAGFRIRKKPLAIKAVWNDKDVVLYKPAIERLLSLCFTRVFNERVNNGQVIINGKRI